MESLPKKESTKSNNDRAPLSFHTPEIGTPGSENDAIISKMVDDGCTWAEIEEAAGTGVFERYKDVLDPSLLSLWSSDAITKLNGIVQRLGGYPENMETVLSGIPTLDKNNLDDLPWEKIADEMRFPSPGGCKYVWSSFGNGRYLSPKINYGNTNEENESKSIGTLGLGLSIEEDQVEMSKKPQPSFLKEGLLPNNALQNTIQSENDLNHTAGEPIIDIVGIDKPNIQVKEAQQSQPHNQDQLEKLYNIQRTIQNVENTRRLEHEQRRLELEYFLQEIALCKEMKDATPNSSPLEPPAVRSDQLHHIIKPMPTDLEIELGKRRRDNDQDDNSTLKLSFELVNNTDSIITPQLVNLENFLNTNDHEQGDSSSIAQTTAFAASQDFAKRHKPNNSLDQEEDLGQTTNSEEHFPALHQAQQINSNDVAQVTAPRHEKQAWTAEDAMVLWKTRQKVGDNWEYISNEALNGKHSPNACRIYVHGVVE